MPFLSPNRQCQSTEGITNPALYHTTSSALVSFYVEICENLSLVVPGADADRVRRERHRCAGGDSETDPRQ